MKHFILAFLFFSASKLCHGQSTDSLMRSLESARDSDKTVIATFKSSRLILSQTTTTVKKYNLDFKVVHRFGDVGGPSGGSKTLWGLDNSSDIYLNLEYGISDRLNIAFGRSKYEQLLDLQLKYALLQQTETTPISISLLAKTGLTPYKVNTTVFDDYSNRFSYFTQAILSRKFSSNLSLQVAPSLLKRGVVLPGGDEDPLFALGAARRYKFTKRFSMLVDYYHVFSEYRDDNPNINYYSPLGLGFEIETGGHVFTLTFVNARAIVENNFIPNSTSSWRGGEYRFGFTISRMFTLYKPRSEK